MMSLRVLAWNCLGIVGGCRLRALVDLIRKEKPRVLFLLETLCDQGQLESLRIKTGFDNCLGKEESEESPGVALLWMKDVPLHIRNYSARHVDVAFGKRTI
ncbi:putative endonuclease/exonuclease/phosphatase [Rosa chinensis]|uniref:Putative endonuclease/exonuclease/phosphatase n=1 Tax=Rosa chinensis TaxID=74649 RepID=A0A2P6RWM0_ROSCH|nr:putative endonuclease/exonuclease/phosphatase [Rosa chinensis]